MSLFLSLQVPGVDGTHLESSERSLGVDRLRLQSLGWTGKTTNRVQRRDLGCRLWAERKKDQGEKGGEDARCHRVHHGERKMSTVGVRRGVRRGESSSSWRKRGGTGWSIRGPRKTKVKTVFPQFVEPEISCYGPELEPTRWVPRPFNTLG